MINKVTLLGHLGKNPETKQNQSGAKVVTFSLATSENYRDKSGEWQKQTEWHRLVCYGKLADKVEQFEKGALVYVDGKLRTRSWEDKDGNRRYTTEVVASYVRYINKPSELASNPQPVTETASPSDVQAEPVAADDDLPF